jgi:hypothetical protein
MAEQFSDISKFADWSLGACGFNGVSMEAGQVSMCACDCHDFR